MIKVTTKYPELVEAARAEGIELNKVFMKLDTAADGSITAKYPITTVQGIQGGVDADGDGDIDHPEWDQGRIDAAEKLAKMHGEDGVLASMKSLGIAL